MVRINSLWSIALLTTCVWAAARQANPPFGEKFVVQPAKKLKAGEKSTAGIPLLSPRGFGQMGALERRQLSCPNGYGYCSNFGRCCPLDTNCCEYGYCIEPEKACCPSGPCPAGWNCCGQSHCYPEGGECCTTEFYCDPGNHCYLYHGRQLCCTDAQCTAVVINGQTSYRSTRTPVNTQTFYQYYTYTLTFTYYYYFITFQQITSSRTYDITTVSVRASDSEAASNTIASITSEVHSSLSEYASSVVSSLSSETNDFPASTPPSFPSSSVPFGFPTTSGFPSFSVPPVPTLTGPLSGEGPDAAATFRPGWVQWLMVGFMCSFAAVSGILMVWL